MFLKISPYLKNVRWQQINQLSRCLSPSLIIFGLIGSFCLSIPTKSVIARLEQPQAQGILVLGGGSDREIYAAHFAKDHPHLPVWLSTGKPYHQAKQNFKTADINLDRVYLDYRAVDTVTNFTTLVDDFEKQKIKHVYLITSDFHLPRATAIAAIVLGSRGITFTTIGVPAARIKESRIKILRDSLRGIVWLLTGKTGASLNPRQWRHFG